MSLFEWLVLAAGLDLDGVELYPRFFASLDPAYLNEVRHALTDNGLQMPMRQCLRRGLASLACC